MNLLCTIALCTAMGLSGGIGSGAFEEPASNTSVYEVSGENESRPIIYLAGNGAGLGYETGRGDR